MDDETLVEELVTVDLVGGPFAGQTRQVNAECCQEGVVIRVPWAPGEAAHYAPDHPLLWVFQGWVIWEDLAGPDRVWLETSRSPLPPDLRLEAPTPARGLGGAPGLAGVVDRMICILRWPYATRPRPSHV